MRRVQIYLHTNAGPLRLLLHGDLVRLSQRCISNIIIISLVVVSFPHMMCVMYVCMYVYQECLVSQLHFRLLVLAVWLTDRPTDSEVVVVGGSPAALGQVGVGVVVAAAPAAAAARGAGSMKG